MCTQSRRLTHYRACKPKVTWTLHVLRGETSRRANTSANPIFSSSIDAYCALLSTFHLCFSSQGYSWDVYTSTVEAHQIDLLCPLMSYIALGLQAAVSSCRITAPPSIPRVLCQGTHYPTCSQTSFVVFPCHACPPL